MESDDEFNQFVMNEVVDPSSSDDEDDPFFGATQMIIEDSANNPGRIGSVEGHDVLDLGLDIKPARLVMARLVIARLVNILARLGSLY